ncbi:MAG: permease prefix domain 1-containing protein [Butyrivibrio sp.]|nr:permease prefix domain 1-containing protein [Acetatifactor muris]MCM1559345.1 permease prefix domain 1-containing protein [Butyrivibrio sp.]
MKEKITQYFDQLFEDGPKTRKALELKREMTQNALDKYEDLVQEGHSEADAYQNVIQSIGDVTELFEEVEEKNLLMLPEKDRKKRAMIKAVAIGLYILAGVAFFAMEILSDSGWMNYEGFGIVLAGLICIAPTIMMVYAANMYPDYSRKENADMVEKYKRTKYLNNRDKAIMGAVSSIIWSLTLVIYFIVSFTSGAWYITWVTFLIGACVQSVAVLINSLRKEKRL